MKNKTITILASMLILAFILNFPMNIYSTVKQAQDAANELARILASRYGLYVRTNYNYGFLYKGEYEYMSVTLYQGNTYYLVAGGCNSAYDIDLFIYDGYGNLIDRDNRSDQLAMVVVKVTGSGTFYVKIKMHNARSSGAHWALVYAYK